MNSVPDGFRAVAPADSLAEGRCRTVEVGGWRLLLAKVGGQFYAVDDTCPHRGAPLGNGFLDDCTVHCPLHGWAFDVRTGAGLTNPDKPLRRHASLVHGGQVWVQLGDGAGSGANPL